ncbi:fucosyltransferase 2 [Physcomitrium patens]|nr:fucosyltransferase 2-like [Physcomitrium patens]XP_024371978.1 fucosyltransferase 2-like [Physcomitrium patens]PNR61845.1 hypothetical protein PHYPA_000269 [Physcomitrium patens]|eukprot:XP_024371333.1 fucosyltransferase 2-like [Physcomitrella patens]
MTKDGAKGVSLPGNAILLGTLGTVVIFVCLFAMDVETVIGWAKYSSQKAVADISSIRNNQPEKSSSESASVRRDALVNITHDPTCLARTQHLLYRRDPERFQPLPEFDKAWDRYVAMHQSCTQGKNWTQVFLHERNMTVDCNYMIVMEGSGGLGNKLLSLTSAFAYALATDRIVLVESRKHFKDLLCDPFPGSSWYLPEGFPYDNVWGNATRMNVAISKNFTDVDNFVRLSLDHIQTWADGQFFCDHTHNGLAKVRWLAWTSNQYFITRLLMIPRVWERLNPLAKPGQIFTILSHKLLLPNNKLWAHVVRLYFAYLAGSSRRVGVQVRLHGRPNLAEFDPVVYDRILDCLQTNRALPKLREEEDVSDLMSFARNGYEGSTEISVLVTSLQLRYYDEMKDLYVNRPNVNGTVIRFHMVSHLDRQDGSMHQSETAFVEMWLLSFSDVLLISRYSTFGYIPQGIGGIIPSHLNTQTVPPGQENNASSCHPGISTQPCTHFPQKPRCDPGSTGNESHREWMRCHVRECVDHEGGLQLVQESEQPNESARLWGDVLQS